MRPLALACLLAAAAPAAAQSDPHAEPAVTLPDPRDEALKAAAVRELPLPALQAPARRAEPAFPAHEDPDDARFREKLERQAQQGTSPELGDVLRELRGELGRKAPRAAVPRRSPRAAEGAPCARP
jgi:hypothetical protein